MATPEPSSKRTPTRSKVEFEPPSELAKYLPYLAAAAGFGVLVLTVTRSARYGVYAATALLAIAFLGLAYVAWEHTATLPDGDRLRPMLRAVTVAVLLATVGPAAITLHPPAPQSVVQLTRPGDRAEVTVRGAAATVVLEAEGAFRPDVGTEAQAHYELTAARGSTEERVRGLFQRASEEGPAEARRVSATVASRHVLGTIHGAGPMTVILDRLPESVQPPLRVVVRAEPFSQKMLAALFALLAVAVLWVDVKVSRRKIESAYAASMGVVLASTFYLHGHFTRASLPSDLLAATLVGVLGGGVGGEILARIARGVAPGKS
nr:hypothetical protein [Deltaproteobacteria bacterium]